MPKHTEYSALEIKIDDSPFNVIIKYPPGSPKEAVFLFFNGDVVAREIPFNVLSEAHKIFLDKYAAELML